MDTMSTLTTITILAFMVVTAIAIGRVTRLFTAIMLLSIYSLLSASLFVLMDAVDVAFTEAAVGAGISTILLLATLTLTHESQCHTCHHGRWQLLVVILTGALLIYGTLDFPHYGDPHAPVHTHVAPHYLEKSAGETGLPNVVTSVLASYRGFDTLGEVMVIFCAGIGVLMLLGHPATRRRKT